jgi:hypothetical protein
LEDFVIKSTPTPFMRHGQPFQTDKGAGETHPPALNTLLLVLLERQNLSSTIHTAFLANTVGEAGCAAIRAQCDLHAFVTVGGMTRTNRTLADFTLLNCHCSSPE